MNKLYEMKLNEYFHIEGILRVVRVLGGWLYESYNEDSLASSFVPFDNEFMGNSKNKESMV